MNIKRFTYKIYWGNLYGSITFVTPGHVRLDISTLTGFIWLAVQTKGRHLAQDWGSI